MTKIFISNDIQITGLRDDVLELVTRTLTLDNPMYWKLVRMAKRDPRKQRALYGCPQTFKYYKINGETLHIPRGMRNRLLGVLDKVGIEYELKEDVISKPANVIWSRNLELRDWQAEACNSVVGYNEAMVIAGTGGGKTLCLLEVAYRLGLTCTILTSKTSMVKQWKDELAKFYGVEAGTIYAKEKKISDFTISTFQSLREPNKLTMDLVANTSILIVDEAQEIVAKGKRKVISRFKPKYIFGTTATTAREDKQDKAINFYLGNSVYEHHETMEEPVVQVINTGVKIEVDEYPQMIDEMVTNESRNNLITGLVMEEAMKKRKILVLTKRVAHAQLLYDRFANWETTYLIHSGNKDKDNLLAEFKKGDRDFSIIFGTTSLLSVGTDIPALDTLVLACDMKAETLLVQSIGRVLRLFKGKAAPKIIDFNDGEIWNEEGKKEELNIILLRQFQHRMRIYKTKGWKILLG